MFCLTPLCPRAEKERRCPVCREYAGRGHGQVERPIRDVRYEKVRLQRMRCGKCGYAHRAYPEGLEPYRQRSCRVRQLGVMLYALGLSYRKVEMVLKSLEAPASDTTVMRDVQGAGAKVRQMHEALPGKVQVRRVGMDGTGVPMAGEGAGLVGLPDAVANPGTGGEGEEGNGGDQQPDRGGDRERLQDPYEGDAGIEEAGDTGGAPVSPGLVL